MGRLTRGLLVAAVVLTCGSTVAAAGVLGSNAGQNLLSPAPIHCEYFNASCVAEAHGKGVSPGGCHRNITCPLLAGDDAEEENVHKGEHCYTVWENVPYANDTDHYMHPLGVKVKMMGCINGGPECEQASECVEEDHVEDGHGHLFCCCKGDFCNSQIAHRPRSTTPKPTTRPEPNEDEEGIPLGAVLGGLISVIVLVLFFVIVFVWRLRRKDKQRMGLGNGEAGGRDGDNADAGASGGRDAAGLPDMLESQVDLLEVKASGRFGKVWKGQLPDGSFAAVKVFPLQEKQSWRAEVDVYRLPRMAHDNVLGFIGWQVRGQGLEKEFYLLTEFHARGSLCDHLRRSTVTWAELCKIAFSVSSGLAHLHEELPRSRGHDDMKLAVAHRDFKSKNVLLKEDLTACIGDFGLAFIFEPGKPVGDTHGQVGTRRYMAPEVLEGAITFSRDSFLRIDMYACGLVLWELASRCVLPDSPPPADYRMPFEDEAPHPSLEQMTNLVVNRKMRPPIPPEWGQAGGAPVKELIATIRDCWDDDVEARLSASNVVERVKVLRQSVLANGPSDDHHITAEQSLNVSAPSAGSQAEEHELQPLIVNGDAVTSDEVDDQRA